jgi:hypothetical protein
VRSRFANIRRRGAPVNRGDAHNGESGACATGHYRHVIIAEATTSKEHPLRMISSLILVARGRVDVLPHSPAKRIARAHDLSMHDHRLARMYQAYAFTCSAVLDASATQTDA